MFRHRYLFLALVASVLVSGLFFGLNGNIAEAGLVACRSDPLVLLSDGTVVDVSAEVDTLLWNVTEVHYTLHIPEGLSPVLIVHTPAWLTSQETFTILADNPPHLYTSTTTVQTRQVRRAVTVTAHMLVNLGYANASGATGETLRLELKDN